MAQSHAGAHGQSEALRKMIRGSGFIHPTALTHVLALESRSDAPKFLSAKLAIEALPARPRQNINRRPGSP